MSRSGSSGSDPVLPAGYHIERKPDGPYLVGPGFLCPYDNDDDLRSLVRNLKSTVRSEEEK